MTKESYIIVISILGKRSLWVNCANYLFYQMMVLLHNSLFSIKDKQANKQIDVLCMFKLEPGWKQLRCDIQVIWFATYKPKVGGLC